MSFLFTATTSTSTPKPAEAIYDISLHFKIYENFTGHTYTCNKDSVR